MIRKPQSEERASSLRRTAEATIETGKRAGQEAHKAALGCQAVLACCFIAPWIFGALVQPTWGRKLAALFIEGLFFGAVYGLARLCRRPAGRPVT